MLRSAANMYDFGLVMMLGCAVAFYRIGEIEYGKGLLLGAISILVWMITAYVLTWRWIPSLCAQAGLFGLLTIINIFRGPRPKC